jgi:hypothetical protein
MSRGHPGSRHIRSRIAHLAARLIAEDGIADFAAAKRKAARQIGPIETRNLPTNEEVGAALQSYLQLYQADEQAARLKHLRAHAVEMMHRLERFNPQLSGPVLDGNAGRYSEIELHLFTDNAKDVELFMLNNRFDYRSRERYVYRRGERNSVPAFTVFTDDATYNISVFTYDDLRANLSNTLHGKPLRHAGVQSVMALQAAADDVSGSR